MATKKERAEAAKRRDKRAKVLVVVGAVALLGVGAFEIPSVLKTMNKKPPGNTTYDPGPSLTPGGLPNVAAGAAPGAGSGSLASDAAPASSTGQLVSFSAFETKNPFAPQVSSSETTSVSAAPPPSAAAQGAAVPAAAASAAPAAPEPSASRPTASKPTASKPASVSVVPVPATPPAAVPPPATTTTTTTTTAAPRPTITLKVNGVVSHVATDGTFPAGAPVFRLVSWTNGVAQIGIVGGSYQTGDAALALHVGEPVILENQTNGKRYRIELLATG